MAITRQRVNKLEQDVKRITGGGKVFVCYGFDDGYHCQGKVYKNIDTLQKENSIDDNDKLVRFVLGGEPRGIFSDV